ncbi:hypothetical protein H0H93_003674, partial [Arthromyces matolae]
MSSSTPSPHSSSVHDLEKRVVHPTVIGHDEIKARKLLGKITSGAAEENETKRGMHSRHLTMIAIGGTIGTGIFLSAGS